MHFLTETNRSLVLIHHQDFALQSHRSMLEEQKIDIYDCPVDRNAVLQDARFILLQSVAEQLIHVYLKQFTITVVGPNTTKREKDKTFMLQRNLVLRTLLDSNKNIHGSQKVRTDIGSREIKGKV